MGGFEPGIDKHVAGLVRLIEAKYLSRTGDYRPMDLALKCNYFALDVISELGFGAAFGFLAEDRDLFSYNERTRRFFPFVMLMSNVPLFLSMLGRWPVSALGPTAGDAAGFGRLMQCASPSLLQPSKHALVVGPPFRCRMLMCPPRFAASFVDGRLAAGAKRGRDMMQSFIDSGLTREQLMQEVFIET